MEISFKKVDNLYEAEVHVTSDFNIHLERESNAAIRIKLKTAGTTFVDTYIFDKAYRDFDCDFTGYVYPKTIKIISYSKVNSGYVTENA